MRWFFGGLNRNSLVLALLVFPPVGVIMIVEVIGVFVAVDFVVVIGVVVVVVVVVFGVFAPWPSLNAAVHPTLTERAGVGG